MILIYLSFRTNLGKCNFSVIFQTISQKKPIGQRKPQNILPNNKINIKPIIPTTINIGSNFFKAKKLLNNIELIM